MRLLSLTVAGLFASAVTAQGYIQYVIDDVTFTQDIRPFRCTILDHQGPISAVIVNAVPGVILNTQEDCQGEQTPIERHHTIFDEPVYTEAVFWAVP